MAEDAACLPALFITEPSPAENGARARVLKTIVILDKRSGEWIPQLKGDLPGGSREAWWEGTAEHSVGTRAEAERRVSGPGPWQRRLEVTPASYSASNVRGTRRSRSASRPLPCLTAQMSVLSGPLLAFGSFHCPRGKD